MSLMASLAYFGVSVLVGIIPQHCDINKFKRIQKDTKLVVHHDIDTESRPQDGSRLDKIDESSSDDEVNDTMEESDDDMNQFEKGSLPTNGSVSTD